MKKHFLLLLWMTLLPFTAFADDITVNLINQQYEYGTTIPTTVSESMFSVQGSLPTGVTKAQVAAALQITYLDLPTSGTPGVGNYHYSMTTVSGYNETGQPLAGHNIFFFGGGNDGLLKIVKKPITIAAVDASKFYGEEEPELTAHITNGQMVGDETLKYTVTRAEGFTVATYPINVNVTEDEVSANYDITTVAGTFTINAKPLAQNDLTIDDIPSVPFNASYWKPELNIKYGEVALEKGTDYTVAYTNNSNPGTATATVTLKGNYQNDGGIAKNFTITKYDLSNDADYASKIQVTGYSGLVYDGKAKTPAVTVKLNGVSYANAYVSRSWENNINATTENLKATLTLTGAAGAFKGTKVIDVEIAPKPLDEVTVSDIADQDFTGSELIPAANLSFNNGEGDIVLDAELYTVEGTNNINVGEATLTFKAKVGTNYTGSTTKTFNIKPATVYIIPQEASKKYGQDDPAFTYKVEDLSGNTLENSVLNGTVTLARSQGPSVGNYKIYVVSYTPNPEIKDNYAPGNVFNDVDNTDAANRTALFTIKADATSTLTLKFKDGVSASKVYDGTANVAYTLDDLEVVSGLLGTDTWESLKASAIFTYELASKDATYENNKVTATITGLDNYPNIEVQPLAFTVTKRPIGIKPIAQTKNYGEAISQGSGFWKYSSTLATGDTKGNVLVELYTDKDVATFAPGDTYEGVIKARIADKSNYDLDETNSVWGNLIINAATELALDDSKDDNLTQIAAFNGQPVNVTINFSSRNGRDYGDNAHDIEWNAAKWTTMVLPFDISVKDLSKALGYAIVNVIDPTRTVVEGTGSKFYGKLTMTGGNGDGNETKLVANKPFLVKTADAINGVIDFGTQTVVAPSEDLSVGAGQGAKFVGTYAKKTVAKADNANIWFMNGDEEGWQYIGATSNATWNIVPFEAYIDMTTMSGGAPRNMTFFFEEIDGSTTAIKSIETDNQSSQQSAEGWYTLNGVKLMSAPTQKGVYIKDGKKVVVK